MSRSAAWMTSVEILRPMCSQLRARISLATSVCIWLLLLAPAFSDTLAPERAQELKPTLSLPLLGGRLTIQLSRDAVSSARPPDSIMSPEQSQESETRIITPLEDGRLVVFARETYSLADPQLLETLADEKLGAHPTSQSVGSLTILSQNPSKWVEVVDGGDLVNEALIVLPDQTVARVQFFVNPTVKNKEALRDFAMASLATLRFQHKLVTGGRFEDGGVVVSLPEGWAHSVQQGEDFTVHTFRLLQKRGQPTESFGFYVGGWPSYQHDQSHTPFTQHPGKWLGRDVSWHVSREADGTFSEAELPLGRWKLHVWYSGDRARVIVDGMTAK